MTQTHHDAEKPFRAGVFGMVDRAEEAVTDLLASGFTVEQITVVCSDEFKERYFREFEHAQPAGTNTPAAAAIGGAVGAALGGISTAAASIATGLDAAAIGGAGLWTGGVLGGFIGAMMTRGTENELSNFYQQGVPEGKILVAAEAHGPEAEAMLARASAILAEKGAEPLSLSEG
jgi:hypothetical protein